MKIPTGDSPYTQEIGFKAGKISQKNDLFSNFEKLLSKPIDIDGFFSLSRDFLDEYNARYEVVSISSILQKHLNVLKIDMSKAIPTKLLIAADDTRLFVAGRRQIYLSDKESQQYDEIPTDRIFASLYKLHENFDTDAISVLFDGRSISIAIPTSDHEQDHSTKVLGVNQFTTIGGIRADLIKPSTIARIYTDTHFIHSQIQNTWRLDSFGYIPDSFSASAFIERGTPKAIHNLEKATRAFVSYLGYDLEPENQR